MFRAFRTRWSVKDKWEVQECRKCETSQEGEGSAEQPSAVRRLMGQRLTHQSHPLGPACPFTWAHAASAPVLGCVEGKGQRGSADDPVRWLLSLWLIPALSSQLLQTNIPTSCTYKCLSPLATCLQMFLFMCLLLFSICYSHSGE